MIWGMTSTSSPSLPLGVILTALALRYIALCSDTYKTPRSLHMFEDRIIHFATYANVYTMAFKHYRSS